MMNHVEAAEIIVRTALDHPDVAPAPVGDLVEGDFRLRRDENENCIYVKVGEKDIDSYIQSFKNGCSLQAILDRIGLMPVRDKIAYLQQQQNVCADLSSMPTDGTAAFIAVQKAAKQYPEIFDRISKGESFDTVVKDYFTKKTEPPAPAKDAEPVKEGE